MAQLPFLTLMAFFPGEPLGAGEQAGRLGGQMEEKRISPGCKHYCETSPVPTMLDLQPVKPPKFTFLHQVAGYSCGVVVMGAMGAQLAAAAGWSFQRWAPSQVPGPPSNMELELVQMFTFSCRSQLCVAVPVASYGIVSVSALGRVLSKAQVTHHFCWLLPVLLLGIAGSAACL